MISGIIIFLIVLIASIIHTAYHHNFEKGEHFSNFMFVLTSVIMATVISACGMFLVFCGSAIYSGQEKNPPKKLVDTESSFLAQLESDTYVSISSNEYIYGTKDKTTVHLQKITADNNTFVHIYEDTYSENERPMIFIDHYVIGGTTFIDYFTLCRWVSEEEYVSFYIPEDSAKIAAITIN